MMVVDGVFPDWMEVEFLPDEPVLMIRDNGMYRYNEITFIVDHQIELSGLVKDKHWYLDKNRSCDDVWYINFRNEENVTIAKIAMEK